MEKNTTSIPLCEFLLTIQYDIPTHQVLHDINTNILNKYGFLMESGSILSTKNNDEICNYSINKLYHINNNYEDIHFLIKIDAIEKNQIEETTSDLEKEQKNEFEITKDIEKLREIFYDKLKRLNIKKSFLIKDNYASILLKKSYPVIFDIENLMRELIFKTMNFMGQKNWENKEIPNTVKNQIKEDRKDLSIYGADFSHLQRLLFEKTEKDNINKLLSKIDKLSVCNENLITELKNLIPKSNWEKYFSNIHIKEDIEIIRNEIYKKKNLSDMEIITKILQDLNEIRNKVAHNNIYISYNFFRDLEKKSYIFKNWIKNSIEYIENKAIEQSTIKIIENLSKNESELYNKINNLIDKASTYYQQDEENLTSFFYNNFYEDDPESDEDKKICKYKCIRDIQYFLYLKKGIIQQERDLSKKEYIKNIDDINELIDRIEIECPNSLNRTNRFNKRRE